MLVQFRNILVFRNQVLQPCGMSSSVKDRIRLLQQKADVPAHTPSRSVSRSTGAQAPSGAIDHVKHPTSEPQVVDDSPEPSKSQSRPSMARRAVHSFGRATPAQPKASVANGGARVGETLGLEPGTGTLSLAARPALLSLAAGARTRDQRPWPRRAPCAHCPRCCATA